MIKIDLTKIASHKTPIFAEKLRKTAARRSADHAGESS
jgi:hypothetical protein